MRIGSAAVGFATWLAATMFAGSVLAQDIVKLKNGARMTGTIVEESDKVVVLRTGSGLLTFPRSEIKTIQKAGTSAGAKAEEVAVDPAPSFVPGSVVGADPQGKPVVIVQGNAAEWKKRVLRTWTKEAWDRAEVRLKELKTGQAMTEMEFYAHMRVQGEANEYDGLEFLKLGQLFAVQDLGDGYLPVFTKEYPELGLKVFYFGYLEGRRLHQRATAVLATEGRIRKIVWAPETGVELPPPDEAVWKTQEEPTPEESFAYAKQCATRENYEKMEPIIDTIREDDLPVEVKYKMGHQFFVDAESAQIMPSQPAGLGKDYVEIDKAAGGYSVRLGYFDGDKPVVRRKVTVGRNGNRVEKIP